MHVVIMGCGRVGSALAHSLEDLDHTVAVIDRDKLAFRRLGPTFRGQQVAGVGFDRDTLVESGIERAGAFAAVSSGDNSNIISARVARETFGVDNVVARIYDPKRVEVYQRLGIPSVGTVKWTTDNILRRLLPEGSHAEWRDPTGHIALAEVAYNPAWVGRRLVKLELAAGVRVAFLRRNGDGALPGPDTVLQEDDLVYVAAETARLADVERIFASAPVAQ